MKTCLCAGQICSAKGRTEHPIMKRELIYFFGLALAGVIASYLNIQIPHTDVYIEGRWAFGFIGFVVLRQPWLALLLAFILSAAGPYGSISFAQKVTGNMMYAVPVFLVFKSCHHFCLSRIKNTIAYGLGWLGLVLLCYQFFIMPVVWGYLAHLKKEPIWEYIIQAMATQPLLFESIGVAIFVSSVLMTIQATSDLQAHQAQLESQNEQLQTALAEKEALLRELYHRTKNNMQVIRSMLAMEDQQSRHEEVHEIVQNLDNKIQAMSLVHQKLYQSRNLSEINMRDYIQDLCQLMVQSQQRLRQDVSFEYDLEPVYMLIDTAVPLGLIISELITNVFKYAFPDNRTGVIRIGFKKDSEQNIELFVEDNGIGVAKDFDFSGQKTLGLQTVSFLVRHQLGGHIDFYAKDGFGCRVRFQDTQYQKRV